MDVRTQEREKERRRKVPFDAPESYADSLRARASNYPRNKREKHEYGNCIVIIVGGCRRTVQARVPSVEHGNG